MVSGSEVSLDKDVYGLDEQVIVSGIVPTSDSSVIITVTKPDGTKTTYGTSVDNQRFFGLGLTPVSEKISNSKI